ncbi:MAG: hypothetical protein KTR31_24285 [Myxococcales bacterium]|nr:hypothetical protein [Myxococcales bacterium]
MDLEIRWPRGRWLQPEARLILELPLEVELELSREHAYAWLDGDDSAPASDALTPAQLRTIQRYSDHGPSILAHLGRFFDAGLRLHLEWSHLRFTLEEADEHVFVELSGIYTGEADEHLAEHGIGAVLLGDEVIAHGERNPTWTRRGHRPTDVPARPHPDYRELSRAKVRSFLQAGDLDGLDLALRGHDGVEDGFVGAGAESEQWLWSLPPLIAAQIVPSVARLIRHLNRSVDDTTLDRSLPVVRALVQAQAYRIDGDPLCTTTDPERVRRWVAVGARPDGQRGGRVPQTTPVWVHRNDAAMVDTLLELGADPHGLVDEFGHPYEPVPDATLQVLWRHHPTLRPSPEASEAVKVLDLWQRLGWIELAPGADAKAVEGALVGLLRQGGETAPLIEALLQIPGVDEIYVADDELDRFLAAW